MTPLGTLKQFGILYWDRDRRASRRSSDNDSTGFWPPGSLQTMGADGHI